MTETIYIALLDEGTAVRRPAPAYRRTDGRYIVLKPKDYDPELESWEFPPGSVVECENTTTAAGDVLAAVREANDEVLGADRRVG
jgi:hypothetical protein